MIAGCQIEVPEVDRGWWYTIEDASAQRAAARAVRATSRDRRGEFLPGATAAGWLASLQRTSGEDGGSIRPEPGTKSCASSPLQVERNPVFARVER